MARYQIPPDPRQPESEETLKRIRHQRRDQREPIPWLWLGLGGVVTLVAVALAYSLALAFLSRTPLPVSPVAPTLIILTAPPASEPTATTAATLPTPIPTFTPIPTPDVAVAPDALTIDFYATVANTDGTGVRVRGGPSVNNVSITIAPEASVVLILDGPTESDGFLWWQIRMEDGTEGWAAGDFLEPAPAPDG